MIKKFIKDLYDPKILATGLVDLGLPSGTLWSTRNLGATSMEDLGLYFRWGELEGYKNPETNKKVYDKSGDIFANYSNPYSNTLLPKHDAAYNMSNGTLCIPSVEDFAELVRNTISSLYKIDGVVGYVFAKGDNSIFLPILNVSDNNIKSAMYLTTTRYSNSMSSYSMKHFFREPSPYPDCNIREYDGRLKITIESWDNYQLIRPVLKK